MLQITCYHGTDPSAVQQKKHRDPICVRRTTPTDKRHLQPETSYSGTRVWRRHVSRTGMKVKVFSIWLPVKTAVLFL